MPARLIQFCSSRVTAILAGEIIIFALIFGPVVLLPRLADVPFSSPAAGIFAALLLISARFEKENPKEIAAALASMIAVILYFASDLLFRPHGYIRIEFPFWFFSGFALTFYLFFTWYRSKLSVERLSAAALGAIIGAGLSGYISVIGDGLIFSDDHPGFLYRLIQLKAQFPRIPFYNPSWNCGVEAREFFPSAALSLFFLFWPLIKWGDVTASYSAIVGSLIFLILPLSAAAGCRLAGYGNKIAALSAAFVLTASLRWYRWALVYGTMGFVVASVLLPLGLFFLARLAEAPHPRPIRLLIGAVLTLSLILLWSPAGLLLAPAFMLMAAQTVFNPARRRHLIFFFFALAVVNLPWMAVFLKVSRVGDFVSVSAPVAEAGQAAPSEHLDSAKFKPIDADRQLQPMGRQVLEIVRENTAPTSPVILFFGLAGLMLMRTKDQRRIFAVTVCSAVTLGVVGPIFKPQLELERMFVVLAIVLSVSAAVCCSALLQHNPNSGRMQRAATALTLAGLFLLPFWLWKVASNKTEERYSKALPEVSSLVEQLKTCGSQGRVVFAGFTLHELNSRYQGKTRHGGGHIAPLAAWSNRQLVASSYQHDKWQYTDVVPQYFRDRKDQGIDEYLDQVNADCVVTHEPFWRRWYSARTDRYLRRGEAGGFQLFERKGYQSNYFLEGTGEIVAVSDSGLKIRLSSSSAVIKFNFLPFLTAKGCAISPAPQPGGLTFIKLENCSNREPVVIEALPIWKRLISDK